MRIKKATPSDQLNESPLESDKAPDKAKSSGESTKKRASAPYKHGKGFAIRRQYCGHAIFLSGFKTKTAAEQAIAQEMAAIDSGKLPLGRGPDNTILAQALQDYARERLPFLKGAEQEARRINRYLRAADLDLLKVTEIPPQTGQDIKTGRGSFYKVELVEHTAKRTIPQSLTRHRKALLNANADTHTYRARMAALPMTEISHTLMQEFIDVMQSEHNAPSTIALERALLRSLFNHAFRKWNWYALCDNPATKLRMPKVDNERDRVLTVEEQQRLEQALATCRNRAVLPTITLLCETAMRVSEPRKRAVWGDVDWNRSVLHLNDAKAGRRGVPLSPAAIKALNTLKAMGGGKDNAHIVPMSYSALNAAWRRACLRASIKGLKIHDLRHTAATRMALATGNIFIVKALTGHKTDAMLMRYIHVKADDVVKVMQSMSAEDTAPAPAPAPEPTLASSEQVEPVRQPSNVIAFPKRKAA